MKRNLRKLKELKIAMKNLQESKSKAWKTIGQNEKKIQRLNRRTTKLRDDIRELISSEVSFKIEIGRVKGLHCPAKKRVLDYTPYYNCLLQEDTELELPDFYEDACFACKLSERAIYTGILMWKLEGKRKGKSM